MKELGRVLGVAAAYFVVGRLALLMAIPPGYATAVWPAAGIALVCVLHLGNHALIGVALGSFCVNAGTAVDTTSASMVLRSLATPASIGVGAALQSAAASALIRRFVGYPSPLDRERDIARFLALGGPVSCAIAPTWAVTTLVAAGTMPRESALFNWWTWWVGDTIGVLIFAPLLMSLVGQPQSIWRPRRITLGAPLVVGFAVVTMLFVRVSAWESQRLESDFARRVLVLEHSLQQRVSSYVEIVRSIARLQELEHLPSREDFRTFVREPLARTAGLQGLGWNPRVLHSARLTFEEEARRAGLANFEIRAQLSGGALVPSPPRTEYFPVYYLEPAQGNQNVLGFDLGSEPVRAETLERAIDSASAAATPPLALVQQQGGGPGFLVAAPAYSNPMHDTPELRRASLRGFAVGVFRTRDLVETALLNFDREGVSVRISDETVREAPLLMYASASEPDPTSRGFGASFDVAGRRWGASFRPTKTLVAAQRTWQPWMVLAGGLLFVGILGSLLLMVTGRAARVEELSRQLEIRVDERTRDVQTAHETLRRSEANFRTLIERSPAGFVVHRRGEIAYANQTIATALAYPAPEALRARSVSDLLDPEDRARVVEGIAAAHGPGDRDEPVELRVVRRDGKPLWMAAASMPVVFDGQPAALLMLRDVTAERGIRDSLREKEALLKEVHHRVKNNLQVISSMLNLQATRVRDPETKALFAESQSRIRAIALVHEKLYRSRDLSNVDFREYLRTLANGLLEAMNTPERSVSLSVEVEELSLPVDVAIPCGLIVNELVTNALIHAFPDRKSGAVRVGMRRRDAGTKIELWVEDDGVGMDAGFDPRSTTSLGLVLVFTLAQQIHAEVAVRREPGTAFHISFDREG